MISSFRNRRIAAALSTNVSSASPPWLSGGILAINCIGAYNAKGAESLAASYSNLAKPASNNLTVGNLAPSWDTLTGWTGGVNIYLRAGVFTGLLAGVGSAIIGVGSGINQDYFGTRGGNGKFAIANKDTYARNYIILTTQDVGPVFPGGSIGIAGKNYFRNGVIGVAVTGTPYQTPELYILSINNNGTASGVTTSPVKAIWIYDIDITSYLSALTTAMAAL